MVFSSAKRDLLTGALTLFAGFCLLPFIWLARYCHPYLDDFQIPQHIDKQGIYHHVVDTYLEHSGRFSSSLMTALLHPFRWGFDLNAYKWAVVVVVVSLGLSVYVAAHALLADRQLPARYRWAAGSVVLCLVLLWLPSPTEAFYWLVSAQDYIGACIMGFLLLALISRLPANPHPLRRRALWGLTGILCFFTPAFSEMTACIALILALLLVPHWYRARVARGWWWLLGLAALGGALTLVAPGNFVRMNKSAETASIQPLHALFSTTVAVAYTLVNWIGTGILVPVTVLLLPVFQRLAQRRAAPALQRLTQYPLVWPLWLLGSLYATFALTYLSIDRSPPERCRNVLYIFFIVSWLLSVYGWIAWRVRHEKPAFQVAGPVQALLAGLIVVSLWSDHDPTLNRINQNRGLNAVFAAYRDLFSGRAAQYDREQRARYHRLTAPGPPDLVLPALTVQLESIHFEEFSSNPHWWGNESFIATFDKRTMRIVNGPAR